MQYSELGRTGIKVSRVCLGTMTWGKQNTEAEGFAQMDHALERGVNFFDTAEMYPTPPDAQTQGRTEEIVGAWMRERGTRDRIVLATKIAGRSGSTWYRDDGSPTRITPAQIDEAVEKSLRRLRTDVIDLYQIHWPDRDVHRWGTLTHVTYPEDYLGFEETLAHLNRHVEKGSIRHLGVSNETAWGVMRYLAASDRLGLPRMASIQNAYNLVNRTFELGLSEIAGQEQVGLLAYSPLGQGYLTGKYQGGALPPGARKTLFDRLQRYEKVGADAAIQSYVDLARELAVSPAALALRFCDTRPFVTATIVGASSLEQLREDIDAFDLPWTAEMEAAVDRLHNRQPNPCP
jgi:aryl-alcohol dehydrogenase-like predicted oxidoreductase